MTQNRPIMGNAFWRSEDVCSPESSRPYRVRNAAEREAVMAKGRREFAEKWRRLFQIKVPSRLRVWRRSITRETWCGHSRGMRPHKRYQTRSLGFAMLYFPTLVLLLAGGFLMAFTPGCRKSAGPVQQIKIDPVVVSSMTVQQNGGSVIEDPATIRQCVDELNALSCQPYRPPISLAGTEDLILHDARGDRIATFGISQGYCIRVVLRDSEPFYVRYEPIPTIGKLFAFCIYRDAVEELERLADQEQWDEDDQIAVGFYIRDIGSVREELHRQEPKSREELLSLLESLPEPSLDKLEDYPNWFD